MRRRSACGGRGALAAREINDDYTDLTLPHEEESVAIDISNGVLTIGGEVYTQMSEAEGLAASHVCS